MATRADMGKERARNTGLGMHRRRSLPPPLDTHPPLSPTNRKRHRHPHRVTAHHNAHVLLQILPATPRKHHGHSSPANRRSRFLQPPSVCAACTPARRYRMAASDTRTSAAPAPATPAGTRTTHPAVHPTSAPAWHTGHKAGLPAPSSAATGGDAQIVSGMGLLRRNELAQVNVGDDAHIDDIDSGSGGGRADTGGGRRVHRCVRGVHSGGGGVGNMPHAPATSLRQVRGNGGNLVRGRHINGGFKHVEGAF